VYWLGKDFISEVTRQDGVFEVKLTKPNGELLTEDEQRSTEEKFRQSLIDYKTRSVILSETKNIRDLIIMKAFFHFSEEEINFDELLTSEL
jgi:His-Xaa-Ser system protein HxsD